MRYFQTGIGNAETVDPVHLRPQAEHHPERIGNAQKQNHDYEAVKTGVGHECCLDIGKQHG